MQPVDAPQGALPHSYAGSAEVANFGELKIYYIHPMPATNRASETKLVTLGHAPPLQDSDISIGTNLDSVRRSLQLRRYRRESAVIRLVEHGQVANLAGL